MVLNLLTALLIKGIPVAVIIYLLVKILKSQKEKNQKKD